VERLTSEQIRLLEELRELRDSGILTVDEFELQVAKVLGRPLVVEPSPVDEELLAPAEVDGAVVGDISDEAIHEDHTVSDDIALAPEMSPESELLEYEFVAPETSDEDDLLAEENQVVEPPTTSDISALPIADIGSQQNKSGRRKVLIGTTVGLIVIVVIALVALGGGKSDSTSSQINDSTTIVTERTSTGSSDAPTSLGNTQAPATSSLSVVTPTTVTQNASTGTGNRPPSATTSVATPATTSVSNADLLPPIVTNLEISKSHSVFYNIYASGRTVTFTASILNEEQAMNSQGLNYQGLPRLFRKNRPGWGFPYEFKRVQPGIWTLSVTDGDANFFDVGLNEFCVTFTQGVSGQCSGPAVSFEVLDEANPPTISDVDISPAIVYGGATVKVSARVVDATKVTSVFMNFEIKRDDGLTSVARCGEISLISGDERDGIWSTDCVLPAPWVIGQAVIRIQSNNPYVELGGYAIFEYRVEVLRSG
jgi:hypothetical protein